MRLLTFARDGRAHLGVVSDGRVADVSAADPGIVGDIGLLADGGESGLAAVKAALTTVSPSDYLELSSLTLLQPVAAPGKIICIGLNYVDHAKEGGYDVPDYPALFMRAPTSMVAAGEAIVRPQCSERLDYEAELMVIIGRGGRHISQARALDHVFGYTLFNDASIRDYQRKSHQWTPGKNFDGTGAVGPTVLMADELPDGAKDLRIQSRLNGQIMQDANTSDMIFPVALTIEILSEYTTLEPGDMIAMGTPPGVGHARKPPVWMKDGDVVEIEIDKLGILSNPIVDENLMTAGVAAE